MAQTITNEEMRREMLERPIGGLLFQKSLPTVIIQMITVIYNTADTYFVAQINTESAAAVGIVFSLMSIIQSIGFGIAMGTGSTISRKLGQRRIDEANTFGSSGLAAAGLAGIVIQILGLMNLHAIMKFMGASNTVLPYASSYAKYILIAAPFMCISFVLNNILRSEGQTFLSMIGMTSGGILNLFLDPILIFGCGLGIAGAAIATMISQICSAAIMISFFVTGKSIVKPAPSKISRDGSVYQTIVKTGFPTICRQGLGSIASMIMNVQASAYGDAAVAAVSIANKLYALIRNVVLGVGQGYQPIAGYCFGAGKKKRVRELFRLTAVVGTIICLFFAVLVWLFRVPIMTWFRDDPEVIKVGSNMLHFMCLSIPLMAYSTYVNQTYQCLGFAKGATFLACCRQGIMFIPLAFILPPILGLTGIEMLQAMADILTFVVSVPFQIRFFRLHLQEEESSVL